MSMVSPIPDGLPSFEGPEEGFKRVGLPPFAVVQIATAVAAQVGPEPAGLLLDLGVGTGEIGGCLASLPGVRYLALALSLSRLRRLSRRLPRPGRGAFLACADANLSWPVRDGAASLFFLSRAAHLLLPEPLVAEVLRTAHPSGAWVVLGRVRREPSSVRATLRRALHRLLGESGIATRSGEAAHPILATAFALKGGAPLPPRSVATWTVVERPAEALTSWRDKPGLAGIVLASQLRDDVLDRLEAWARRRYGDLGAGRVATESYELSVVRLPGPKSR
jgi:hypothetical protein